MLLSSWRIPLVIGVLLCNFFFWYEFAKRKIAKEVKESCQKRQQSINPTSLQRSSRPLATTHDNATVEQYNYGLPYLRPVLTRGLIDYKAKHLFNIRYPEWSILIQQKHSKRCNSFVHVHASRKRQFSCFAAVFSENSDNAYNLLRFDVSIYLS